MDLEYFNYCLFYFACPILIKLDFIENLFYLVLARYFCYFTMLKFIQIANGNLSRFNIVVLQNLVCC